MTTRPDLAQDQVKPEAASPRASAPAQRSFPLPKLQRHRSLLGATFLPI